MVWYGMFVCVCLCLCMYGDVYACATPWLVYFQWKTRTVRLKQLCMHACVCVCMYVCMYACTYVCMYVCMYIYIYMYMYTCMYVCACVCMHVSHETLDGKKNLSSTQTPQYEMIQK